MHDYLSCVRTIDENVGKLLDYLERESLIENTIIIYASDQGFFLGEHGLQDKRWFYEESLRTPFVMSWPGVVKPGSVDGNMVSVIDFAPTLLEAAGVRPHERMQGRSLMPLLAGRRPADWRVSFYYHFYENAYGVPPHYGMITERYKLIHMQGEYDYWELFDREKDPLEVRSIYDDSACAAIRASLHNELTRMRRELHVPGHENDAMPK
jgi:arylsulfatase A-like enzyme